MITGLWVLKMFVLKNDPLLLWRGDMGQKCIFEESIELWVLKTFILKKNDPLCLGIFQTTWRGDMGQKQHFKVVGIQNIHLEKMTPFCFVIFQI